MKRQRYLLILALLILLSLSACAKRQSSATAPYTVERPGGTVYTVTPADANTGTITDGTYTYSYRYEPSGSSYEVIFTYPDGESYTWKESGNFGSGMTSEGFDSEKYPSGMTLQSLLKSGHANEQSGKKNIGLALLLLIIGGINTAWPQAAWYLDIGWKVKDAEPSEDALIWSRGVGVVVLIIAVIMMIA